MRGFVGMDRTFCGDGWDGTKIPSPCTPLLTDDPTTKCVMVNDVRRADASAHALRSATDPPTDEGAMKTKKRWSVIFMSVIFGQPTADRSKLSENSLQIHSFLSVI